MELRQLHWIFSHNAITYLPCSIMHKHVHWLGYRTHFCSSCGHSDRSTLGFFFFLNLFFICVEVPVFLINFWGGHATTVTNGIIRTFSPATGSFTRALHNPLSSTAHCAGDWQPEEVASTTKSTSSKNPKFQSMIHHVHCKAQPSWARNLTLPEATIVFSIYCLSTI